MARNSLKSVMKLIDAANHNIEPQVAFLNDLKRSIEMNAEMAAPNTKPSQTYKPSSMNCIRNMYYQITGAEPDTPHASYILEGIVNSGTDIHLRIQHAIERMRAFGMNCDYVDIESYIISRQLNDLIVREKKEVETKLYHTKLNMSFMTDGIIRYNDRYYILEIKTESIYKWQSRNGVDPKHYMQGIAYSLAFGIDDVIFLYINRDLLDMKTFMFHVTDDMRMQLVGRIETCDNYVRQKKTPPKEEDKKTCDYCGYKTMCRKEI